MTSSILWFKQLGIDDVDQVGGKNASLGEMISNLTSKGVRVPNGFATTAEAYRSFLQHDGLGDRIKALLAELDVEDVVALAETGKTIRRWIVETPFHESFQKEIEVAYAEMMADGEFAVAVRSSATAEDLPDASFAGQQERS